MTDVNMKKQLIEYLESFEKGFNDRTAIRYLKNRNEELWNWIVEKTSFLPEDAKPKQRCWHVLKDMYKIPTCPIDGKLLTWCENRYREYSSRSAVARCIDITQKKLETYREKTGFDAWNSKLNREGYEKYKKSVIERFKENEKI